MNEPLAEVYILADNYISMNNIGKGTRLNRLAILLPLNKFPGLFSDLDGIEEFYFILEFSIPSILGKLPLMDLIKYSFFVDEVEITGHIDFLTDEDLVEEIHDLFELYDALSLFTTKPICSTDPQYSRTLLQSVLNYLDCNSPKVLEENNK